jgi:hypothetical protein
MSEESKATLTMPRYDQVTTLFADGIYGASVTSGTVRIDLLGLFAEHRRAEGEAMAPIPVVVGRLVIPTDRLQAFVNVLSEIAKRLKEEKTAKP